MRPTRHHSDLELRNRIIGGESEAGSQLLTAHLDALYAFVLYRCGRDAPVAEDIVQDTMLVAIDKLPDFDGRSSLFTWLCGIAKNKLRAERRKLRPVPVEDLLLNSDQEIDAILAEIERTPLPETAIESRETSELVGATMSSLPPNYREALVEKYVNGASVPQMAHRRGKGVKATESTLHRAKLAFTKVFTLLAVKRGEQK
ncbi:MAG: RNA polymerase sigma-70 factor (ECF subfamily) [Planctomycetota bacterium]|jgi:RNA polymerase sigma-70 factor (ECF subfamily)